MSQPPRGDDRHNPWPHRYIVVDEDDIGTLSFSQNSSI
jgi:hypothetical protein